MTDLEIDMAWSHGVAAVAIWTLVHAKIVAESDVERAKAICAEEILVRLIAGDRPDRENWKYQSLGKMPDA